MINPLHIGLAAQGGRNWMGGSEYIRNIILALASLSADKRAKFEIFLLVSSSYDEQFIREVQPYIKQVIVLEKNAFPTIFRKVKWAIRTLILREPAYRYDKLLKVHKIDFVYPIISLNSGFPLNHGAAWIYDFQHKYLSEYFTNQEIIDRDFEFSRIACKSSDVVLSSISAETDFIKFYPDAECSTHVLPFKILCQPDWYEVTPSESQRKYFLPDKFFIISNQFWQHKNHLTVLHALKLLKDTGVEPVVVCTGYIYDYRRPDYSDLVLQTIHKYDLSRQVYLLGLIPKIDQIQLLRRSIALIQPSLFEGWSTVVEDARCLGKPLILSDLPVHREQNPPDSRFFESKSSDSLATEMAYYWNMLTPGPHFEKEVLARENNRKEIIEFADNFIKIAKASTRS